MDDAFDKAVQAAISRAAASGNLDDIEKAASISKTLAEAEKSGSEAKNARRQLRLQSITSFSSILVPIVSLLALVGTIYIQGQQLRETQQQNSAQLEDTQWRDFLTTLRASKDLFESDVTVAPRLRSFFHSTRYGDQAKDISIYIMGRLTSPAGFEDLYSIAFGDVSPDVFPEVLDVARALYNTRAVVVSECRDLSSQYKLPNEAYLGLCTREISPTDLAKALGTSFPQRGFELRQAEFALNDEMIFMSEKIGSYLRSNYGVNSRDEINTR